MRFVRSSRRRPENSRGVIARVLCSSPVNVRSHLKWEGTEKLALQTGEFARSRLPPVLAPANAAHFGRDVKELESSSDVDSSFARIALAGHFF